jgi:hypothetical protein
MAINPQPDGTFRLTLLEGEQRIGNVSGLPPGYALKSLTYGSTDILKNPLKVAASDSFELRATITTSSATPVHVSGRIEGVDLNTLTSTPVRVTMTSPSFPVPLTVDVRPGGTFEFFRVYAGNYRILTETAPTPTQRFFVPVNVGGKDITGLVVTVPK